MLYCLYFPTLDKICLVYKVIVTCIDKYKLQSLYILIIYILVFIYCTCKNVVFLFEKHLRMFKKESSLHKKCRSLGHFRQILKLIGERKVSVSLSFPTNFETDRRFLSCSRSIRPRRKRPVHTIKLSSRLFRLFSAVC